MAIGTKNKWAIDATAEASYGTAAATPDKSYALRANRPRINMGTATDEDALIGVYERGSQSIVTSKRMAASLDMDLRLDALAIYSKYALGALATTGAGPYVHTATVGTADTPSFTAWWQDANSTSGKAERYTGCKVQSLSIRGQAGGKLTMGVEVIGSGVHTEETATMPALSTEAILPFSAISTFTIGGTNYLTSLLEVELTFENEFDEGNEQTTSTTLASLERVGFAVSGRIRLKHDANTLISDVEAQTGRAIVLTITSGSTSATINVYSAMFDDTSVDGQRGKLVKPLTFKGLYSVSDSKACQIAVTNSAAGTTYA